MVPSIAEAVSGFKRNWTEMISSEELEKFFKSEGIKWRDRVLTPVRTVQLMLLQVLHGNTAINHLRHLSDLPFTAGAYTHFNQLIQLQVDVLIRKHQRIITDFKAGREHQTEVGKYGYLYGVARSKWIKAISKEDQIIQWFKPGND